MEIQGSGILFVVSSPSGCGKTTIVNNLIKLDSNIVRSISTTTRKKRRGEVEAKDYFFVEKEEFEKRKNQMLEFATVFDNYYGTSKPSIEALLNQNKDVICVIDFQGLYLIKKKIKTTSIFILPPSMKSLRQRLNWRKKDTNLIIEKRLKKAKIEIEQCFNYDYIIINDDLEKSVKQLYTIIKSERLKTRNLPNLDLLVKNI